METDELVKQWRTGVRISHRAHFDAAARCDRMSKLLGIPTIALSTLVGTSIFASLESSPGRTAKAIAGLAGIASAVLAALQTFLGYTDRAQRHREAALRYGQLRRELDDLLTFPEGGAKLKKRMDDIRARWDEVDAMAPVIPARHQNHARDIVLGARQK